MYRHIRQLLFPLMLVALLIHVDAEDVAPKAHLNFITLMRQFADQTAAVSAVDMASDGKRALTVCGGKIHVWDLTSGAEQLTITPMGSGQCNSAVFAPDGAAVAVGGYADVLLFDAVSGKEVRRYNGHKWGTGSVAMSPDGRLIAGCGGSDYTLPGRQAIVWDVASGRELTRVDARAGESLVFSPDSRLLATGGHRFIRLSDAHTGALVREFNDDGRNSLAFSSEGKQLSVAGYNGVQIWDVATGTSTFRLLKGLNSAGGARFFCAARFMPGDKHLLTIGGGLRLWDITSGTELSWAVDPHMDALHDTARCLALSPDGRFALTDSARQEGKKFPLGARLWTLPGDTRTANPLPPPFRWNDTMRPTPPLTLALKIGDMDRIKALLVRGADVRAMEGPTDRRGATALHYASSNLELIKELLARGAYLEAPDDRNRTVLCLAVIACAYAYEHQDSEKAAAAQSIVEFLIARGADLDVYTSWSQQLTPLRTAAYANHKVLADLLITHGAECDFASVVLLGDIQHMTRMLADDPELANRPLDGCPNPLYYARTAPAIDLLLANGAQIDAKNSRGDTTISLLLNGGEPKLGQIALLQARGADMQTTSKDGRTSIERLHDIERQINDARSKR